MENDPKYLNRSSKVKLGNTASSSIQTAKHHSNGTDIPTIHILRMHHATESDTLDKRSIKTITQKQCSRDQIRNQGNNIVNRSSLSVNNTVNDEVDAFPETERASSSCSNRSGIRQPLRSTSVASLCDWSSSSPAPLPKLSLDMGTTFNRIAEATDSNFRSFDHAQRVVYNNSSGFSDTKSRVTRSREAPETVRQHLGRLYVQSRTPATRGEREIFSGICDNRGNLHGHQRRMLKHMIDVDRITSHQDAWLVGSRFQPLAITRWYEQESERVSTVATPKKLPMISCSNTCENEVEGRDTTVDNCIYVKISEDAPPELIAPPSSPDINEKTYEGIEQDNKTKTKSTLHIHLPRHDNDI